jgi:hypothetical protein
MTEKACQDHCHHHNGQPGRRKMMTKVTTKTVAMVVVMVTQSFQSTSLAHSTHFGTFSNHGVGAPDTYTHGQ